MNLNEEKIVSNARAAIFILFMLMVSGIIGYKPTSIILFSMILINLRK
jgi:hypothetical protein|tara:strand:+ start:2440 stop:2583 length:144 start_codon:yes stop_codon:yes gene_type:complete